MSNKNQIIQHFLSHRSVTNELIQKIEENHYDYKPTPTSMPTQRLVTHMLTSFYKFAAVVKVGNLSPFQEKKEETELNLIKLADTYTAQTVELLESLSEEELEKELDVAAIFGSNITGKQLLSMGIDHEIHHKGNLFVYVREMGHTELPLYVNVK
ncbi:DinB family protein [Metabacillus iocasae]|uniref:Damage-inducible protein DinB n=1 Tax=Priestia iocasae TaxID=2291674 RepID=A0ABS2QVJ2_9BACI|nr:DinB family protein [Metabacillus iocasae]MBM7703218.1 putative damage-inducible protein DinB [Metabacillus iocasae]